MPGVITWSMYQLINFNIELISHLPHILLYNKYIQSLSHYISFINTNQLMSPHLSIDNSLPFVILCPLWFEPVLNKFQLKYCSIRLIHSLYCVYYLFSLLVFVEDVSRDSAKTVGGKGDVEASCELFPLVSGKFFLPASMELEFCLYVSTL
jgi:hypothetical protein